MSEETVIYMLKNYYILKKTYNEAELRLLKELETRTQTINRIASRGRELKGFVMSKTNAPYDPLFNILESVERERMEMLLEQIHTLKELNDKRNRLETLINNLEFMNEPYRSVLKMLYIDNKPWKEVYHLLNISKGSCARYRNKGIKLLLDSMQF